jgi:serine/threonine protein phosphatase PrpC
MGEKSEVDTTGLPSPARLNDYRPGTVSSCVQVDLGALSHQGKLRPNNEDHFLVARFDRTMCTLLTSLPASDIPARYAETAYGMLVADGMGGAAAGEVASRTAIGALVDLVLQTPDWIMRFDEQTGKEVLRRMDQRFRQVKQALIERAESDPSLSGMGTTMTLACSLGTELIIAHSGDSRAYLFRQSLLQPLTHDQTMAQWLADSGAIRPEEVATHPMRHVLTGAIATRGGKTPTELHHLRLTDGDQILLCTDGLAGMVTDSAIAAVLEAPRSAADTCRALVDLALEGGGKDDVTVVLGRYRIPGLPE